MAHQERSAVSGAAPRHRPAAQRGFRILEGVSGVEVAVNAFDELSIPSLTKTALTDLLHSQLGLRGKESRDVVDSFFQTIAERLGQGEDVKLAGFGNFDIQKKRPRLGRNPRTGEAALISARHVVKFSSGPSLKSRLSQAVTSSAALEETKPAA